MATGHFFKTATDVVASLDNTAGSLIAVLDEVLDIASEGYGGTLGWEKPFKDDPTNYAVYRATTGNRPYLQVRDSYGETALVRMYRTMTAHNAGTLPCPNGSPQSTAWCRILKADEAGDHYFITVGDSRYFALLTRCDHIGSYITYAPFCFGDINSFDPLDVGYNSILLATAESTGNAAYSVYRRSFLDIHTTNNTEASSSYIGTSNNTGSFMLGSVDGLIPSSSSLIHDAFGCIGVQNGGMRGIANYASSPALVYAPYYIFDGNGTVAASSEMDSILASHGSNGYIRGTLPYLYTTPYAGYTGIPGSVSDGASTFNSLTYIQTGQQTGTILNARVLLYRTSDDEPGRTF